MIRSLKGLYHLLIACLANCWFGFPGKHLTIIGVTGTDGKTTTTTLIYEILKTAGLKTSMVTSVEAVIAGKMYDTGFHVTTPGAWAIQRYLRESVNHGDTHMVLEVTSHGLAQHRVFGVPFAVGVITNVTHEHLDWHRTYREYLLTKLSLLTRSVTAVINKDESEMYATAIPLLLGKRVVTYGIKQQSDVTPRSHPFTTKLPGIFNRYNCLAAIAAATVLDIPDGTIRKAISDFNGVPGRMETVVTKPYTVVVDFAHTPNALDRALSSVKPLTKKRLIHVFGSAGLRDRSKRPLMGSASGRYSDIIVLTEEDYRTEDVNMIMDEIQKGIVKGPRVVRIPDRARAIHFAIQAAKPGDLVMITGKGQEHSLCRGRTEYPWSDRDEVLAAVRKG
jgi:UDP-N-acetylmuramoyl-L-alanyl-D-glutamate--2,6-diaminopimelate ligase